MGAGGDHLKVRTLRGGGTSKTYVSVQGGDGGQKSIDIERMYFLNGPQLKLPQIPRFG